MSHGDFHDNFLLLIREYQNPDTSVLTSISFSAVPAFDGGYTLLTGKGREYIDPKKIVPFVSSLVYTHKVWSHLLTLVPYLRE